MADDYKIIADWNSRPEMAADDINGIKYPRVKVTIGDDNFNDGDVSAANPLPVTEAGDDYINITGNGTTTAKTGAGVLKSLSVGQSCIGSTVTIYDNTAGSGDKIATINTGTEKQVLFHCKFTSGLTFVTTGATPANITAVYQ